MLGAQFAPLLIVRVLNIGLVNNTMGLIFHFVIRGGPWLDIIWVDQIETEVWWWSNSPNRWTMYFILTLTVPGARLQARSNVLFKPLAPRPFA